MTDAQGLLRATPGTSLRFETREPVLETLSLQAKLGGRDPDGHTLCVTSYYLEMDGRPVLPVMGEFHYARFPHQYWNEELAKIKAGGIDILATYVFWIHHEEEEGHFDWSGDRNLRAFVQLCARHGLQVIVRIGPFAHGECRNGGLPDWLYGRPFAVRSTDPRFLWYVQRLYRDIAAQLTGLLYKEGGPVIGVQLDNEYMHAGAPWEVTFTRGSEWVPAGSEGDTYMLALKRLAIDAGLDVPLYTCTGWIGSPVAEDEFLPLQGGYAFTPWVPDPDYQQPPTREFLFRNRHRDPVTGGEPSYNPTRYPYASCELGGGIQITYHHRPVVPPKCVEAMAVVALGSGANLLGYYMYHGGSQPIGRHGYLNEYTVPRISYDFQAPIREFGQLAESFHHLKLLHLFLHAFGSLLAPMGVALPENAAAMVPENTTTVRLAARALGDTGYLFLTNYQDHVETHDLQDVRFTVYAGGEEITVPHEGGLTVARDASAILPINMLLGAARLIYATTQPLTILDSPGGPTYVFFAVPGMFAEYAFDRATPADIQVTDGTVREAGERIYIRMSPGTNAVFSLGFHDGTQVRVLTLTREQALQCWKGHLAGQDRLMLSDATVLFDDDHIWLSHIGLGSVSVSIYPPLHLGLYAGDGRVAEEQYGIFVRHAVRFPLDEIALQVVPVSADRWVIQVDSEQLARCNDIFLHIDYAGDIGEAYINGVLVADNFYNGTIWEIGLKRFADRLVQGELVLKIAPLRPDGRARRYVSTAMAARLLEDADQQIAQINAVTAVAAHAVALWPGVRLEARVLRPIGSSN